VLTTLRCQAFDIDLFTQLGCNPADRKLVIVKSSQHFYTSYSKIASQIIYVSAPGAVPDDLNSLPFRQIRRPKWPFER
jgi:microcystin degradation protein MlrC